MTAPFYTVKNKITKRRLAKFFDYRPLVSIIIPAVNEEIGIVTTIQSALANTYSPMEIIVVDDGSTDKTAQVVTQFESQYAASPGSGRVLKFISLPVNAGKAKALNAGISHAKGEIIVTMDADSAHRPDTVANLVYYFRDPTLAAVVGNVHVTHITNLVGLLQRLEYIQGFYFKRVNSILGAEYIFGGACAAFRKSLTFDRIGGFDSSTKTEDIEYSIRTQEHGLKSVYAEDVVVYTEGAHSWSGLYKQRLRWKKGRFDVFKKYSHLFFSRKPQQNRFLSWVVLPTALLGEVYLLLEPILFSIIWIYTIRSGDYLSIGLSSAFIFFNYFSATVFGDPAVNKLYFILFPTVWLLFYLIEAVEFIALITSLRLLIIKKDVVWQSWQRQGLNLNIKPTG